MYSWGSDTSAWKKPGGYDFGSARAPYLDDLAKKSEGEGSRTYSSKAGPDLKLVDAKAGKIRSESKNVLVIGIDGTGSMQKAPAEIFDRLPLMYQTLSKYEPDLEVCFSVIGDAASCDKWPVQISKFGKELELEGILKSLHAEGGGGPGIRESYELWAYKVLTDVETPNATSPFLIIMGDEKFYAQVDPGQAKKYLGLGLQSPVSSGEVWKSLTQRFDTYFLQRPYTGNTEEIRDQWQEAIGPQKVIPVLDDQRFVDHAMGLVAKRWGKVSDFVDNISARQDTGSVAAVMDSLRSVPGYDPSMKSVTKGKKGSGKSVSLTG